VTVPAACDDLDRRPLLGGRSGGSSPDLFVDATVCRTQSDLQTDY
jgi:hypothetical protein